jgi:hypothetical protein
MNTDLHVLQMSDGLNCVRYKFQETMGVSSIRPYIGAWPGKLLNANLYLFFYLVEMIFLFFSLRTVLRAEKARRESEKGIEREEWVPFCISAAITHWHCPCLWLCDIILWKKISSLCAVLDAIPAIELLRFLKAAKWGVLFSARSEPRTNSDPWNWKRASLYAAIHTWELCCALHS